MLGLEREYMSPSKRALLYETYKFQDTNIDEVGKIKKHIKEHFRDRQYCINKRGIYISLRNIEINTTSKGNRYFIHKNVIFVLIKDVARSLGCCYETTRRYINHSNINHSSINNPSNLYNYQISINVHAKGTRTTYLCVPLDYMISCCPDRWDYEERLCSLSNDILNNIKNSMGKEVESIEKNGQTTETKSVNEGNTKKSLKVITHLSNIIEVRGIIFVKYEDKMYVSCRSLCSLVDTFPSKYLKWEGFTYTKLPYFWYWDREEQKKKICTKKAECKSSLVCIPVEEIWSYSNCVNTDVYDGLEYRTLIDETLVTDAVNLAREFLFREDKNMNEENINQEQGTMTTGVFMDKVKNYSKYTIEGMEKLCYAYNTLCKDYNNLSNDYKETTSKLQNCEEEILLLREKARKYNALIELIKQE